MAFAYYDRIKETSGTTGTGTLSLSGALTGFRTFGSVYSNGDTFYYCITDQASTANWEVGLGTYTSSGNLLTRTTVLASSNSGSAVNFTSGALLAFVTLAAAGQNSYATAGQLAYYGANGVSVEGNANITVTSAGVMTSTGQVINPPTTSAGAQGFLITQTGPTGTISGDFYYNEIVITDDTHATGSPFGRAIGLYVNMATGGANSLGDVIGAFFNQHQTTASTTNADHIALTSQMYASGGDSGTGEFYGFNAVATVDGCTVTAVNGVEIDCSIINSGSATRRTGIRVVNDQGTVQASGVDAAYALLNNTAAGAFKTLLTTSTQFGQAALSTSGSWFTSDGSSTVANWANLSNLTVTGDILNFPNVTLTGAGVLTCDYVNIASGQNYEINGTQIATTNLGDVSNGTWTPAITASVTPGTPSYNTGSGGQQGHYYKFGNLVYVQWNLSLNGWTGSPSGNVTITGLPFTSTSNTNDHASCAIGFYSVNGLAALNYGVTGLILASSTSISLYQNGNATGSAITAAQAGTTANIIGSAWYHV